MKPPAFSWVRAKDLRDCVAHLAEAPAADVKVIAGAQSLMPMLALRMARPSLLVDINQVDELKECAAVDGCVYLGALLRHTDLAEDTELRRLLPVVGVAARHIGHVGIRNRGTLAGSLAHADPAAELPAVMTLLNASFTCASVRGTREIAARDFFHGPYTTALEPDELLAGVRIPLPAAPTAYGFFELAPREGDFARAGAACAVSADPDGHGREVRLVLFAVGPVPIIFSLPGEPSNDSIVDAVDSALATLPERSGYQARMARVAARRAVESVLGQVRP